MRKLFFAAAAFAAFSLAACDANEDSATIEVPEDVDVDVQTDTQQIDMPDVDVGTDTAKVVVPDVDVDP